MEDYRWLIYAVLAAVAAAMVGIFGKVGMSEVDSNLATAIRSVVMTAFLLAVCTALRLWEKLPAMRGRAVVMIVLSGVAGATSWLFYFKAIKLATVSRVAPVDKLSMPLAVVLAAIILGDRPSRLNWLGIALIVGGAYLAALPARR